MKTITDQRTIAKRAKRKNFLLRQGARLTRRILPIGQPSYETMLAQIEACETPSPIEVIFLQAAYERLTGLGLFLAQYEVLGGRYRLDFALLTRDFSLDIECDGYPYHHTEPQISADNDRDWTLECAGWRVIRFTGAKINGNAAGCVEQVEVLVREIR